MNDNIGKLVVEGDNGSSVKVSSVAVEGEATVGNRKGKLYYIYELTVTVKWKGCHSMNPIYSYIGTPLCGSIPL